MSDRIIYQPRSGKDVLRAAPPGTGLYLYSSLASDPRDPLDVLLSLKRNNIILLQDPNKMTSGHWIALSFKPESREAYYFSSYGGMPDREKISWLSSIDRIRSGQMRNVINDGLKQLALHGWTIHYNDHHYQHEGDKTATCGIWSAAFLNSNQNPDEFYNSHLSPIDYYSMYF